MIAQGFTHTHGQHEDLGAALHWHPASWRARLHRLWAFLRGNELNGLDDAIF
ncbi:MAG TPA: hypothetical protein VFD32_11085 [Dehalococcoidia bacterium]|nr:hypothetical protein [Dehalococcoidia bacterium]